MISEANQKAIEAAGLSFILGMKIPHVPYVVEEWRRQHPGEDIPDGHVFTQPRPAGPTSKRDQQIYYQYRGRPGEADAARKVGSAIPVIAVDMLAVQLPAALRRCRAAGQATARWSAPAPGG
jgi:hypothetical protein